MRVSSYLAFVLEFLIFSMGPAALCTLSSISAGVADFAAVYAAHFLALLMPSADKSGYSSALYLASHVPYP